MKQVLLVFVGGGLGSIMRYFLGVLFNTPQVKIPYGTFVANILGSLFIGVVLGLASKNESLSGEQTLFLATGLCGGFTTFSTFAYENYAFLKAGDFMSFAVYTFASFTIAFFAIFAGLFLSKTIF